MSGRLVGALILHISIIPHNREEIVFIESCLDAFLDALQFLEDKNKYLNEIIHLIYYISIPKKSLTFWEKCKQAKFVMEKEKYTKSGKNLMSNLFFKKKKKERKSEINSHSQAEGFALWSLLLNLSKTDL